MTTDFKYGGRLLLALTKELSVYLAYADIYM